MSSLHRSAALSFLLIFLAACGSAPTVPSSEMQISEPRGTVIRINHNDLPYTLQGISAKLAPVYKDKSASSGELFLIVLVQIKGELTDRPTTAGKPLLLAQHPGCNTKFGCAPLRVDDAPVTKDYLENNATPTPTPWPFFRPPNLQPGTPYYVTAYASVPASTNLKEIKICDSFLPANGTIDSCIRVSDLIAP
ncbi:hypothetical protein [Streptosporangium sp. NPDC002721]|uniref:hypothetical protein n=1 Tax=Streptosporangium sp. NPDC002721 TaxID=3366188 RepID=UPI0036909C1E